MVNLKYGYGGRTMDATINPITEPLMVARITLAGINHLQIENTVSMHVIHII